jgi:eukaryotic-like serine/threonine-protein kinase
VSIKDFKIDYLIGTGKSSLVYLALDLQKSEVALKIPRDDVRNDPEQANRFATEVNLSVKLDHPNVVKAYSGVPSGPDAYLCLEYFAESSLDQVMAHKNKVDLVTGLRYATQMASALAYVHGQNIIHQDIKAANIFIKEGNVYLGDFGVAVRTGNKTVTAGSPFYMAPEVYRGEGSSFASDVYSLGVFIYELLYGNRPFDGDTYEALMVAHLTQYPKSLATRVPELPKSTLRDLEKALSKNPLERPTAFELYTSLLKALTRLGGKEHYVPPPEPLNWDDETPHIPGLADTAIEEYAIAKDKEKVGLSQIFDPQSKGRHGGSNVRTPPPAPEVKATEKPAEKKGGFLSGLFGRKK